MIHSPSQSSANYKKLGQIPQRVVQLRSERIQSHCLSGQPFPLLNHLTVKNVILTPSQNFPPCDLRALPLLLLLHSTKRNLAPFSL